MNLAASVDLISAACTLLFASVWARVARAPGWADTRWLAAVSATAALYCAGDLTRTLPLPDAVVRWGGQASLGVAGLHGAAWLLFLEASAPQKLARLERAVGWTGVAVALAGLLPGLFFTDRISTFEVAWLGLTYRTPELSPLGRAGVLTFLLAMSALVLRALRRRNEGWPRRLTAVGAAVLVLLGLHDALVTARVVSSPLLLALGFLVVLGGSGLLALSRLIGDARRLEQRSARLELELEQREAELEQAHRSLAHSDKLAAIGRLTAGIAHEINNPAAVVLSNLRYLKQALATEHRGPEDAGEALDDATRCIERIVRVVRELNDAGRVASRRVDVQSSPCELDQVVAKSVTELGTLLPEAPQVQVNGDRGARARVDDALMVQVLLNLLANAAWAVKDRALPEIEVNVTVEERQVHLTIRDNGPGVTAEALPHLFEPFFTTRPQGQGTGLGLPVSLGLISSQGGDLRLIDSSPGGARFRLTVPRA